jgi:hypothetical protein
MWKKLSNTHQEEWSEDSWCVATLQLGQGIAGRAPDASALWLYLLWPPTDRPLPFREPTFLSIVEDDPWLDITEGCDGEPVYELLDDECDWGTWLDMAMHLEGVGDWNAALLRKARKEKQAAKHAHWRNQFLPYDGPTGDTQEQDCGGEDDDDREGDFGQFNEDDTPSEEVDLPDVIIVDEQNVNPHCSCINVGGFAGGLFAERDLGVDTRHSSYGEVDLWVCKICERNWLRFFLEMEAFTASGRWYLGRITPDMAERINAELAVPYLERLPWYWRGGSFFDGVVSKASGKLVL